MAPQVSGVKVVKSESESLTDETNNPLHILQKEKLREKNTKKCEGYSIRRLTLNII
jgi:hypothetical protein